MIAARTAREPRSCRGRRAHAGEGRTLASRAQRRRLKSGLDQRDLQGGHVAPVRPGVGEDRRQVGHGDGVTVLDHLRVAVHVGRHRTLERDLQLRGAGPSRQVGDRDRVDGVDRRVDHAAEVRGERAAGHRVGREDVLAVRPLEQQVGRDHVHAGIAARRVLHDEQRGDRGLLAGRRELHGREVPALLGEGLFLGETAGQVPGAEHRDERDRRREQVQDPRLRVLDPRAAAALQAIAPVSLTLRHESRCTTRVPLGPPRGHGR